MGMKKKLFPKFYFNDRKLLIKDAPEPSDILWTGMSSIKNKKKLRIRSDILVFISMIIFLIILIFFKVLIKQTTSNYSFILQTGFNLIAATLIALANVITGIIIRKNAIKEDRTTQTSYFIQVGRKLTKMFMINMLLTTFFSSFIYNSFILSDEDKQDTTTILFINYVIGEYFFLFITNSYISSIMSISDIVWIARLIKRHFMEKSIKQDKCWKSQAEANELYEGHPIDMALRYANVLKVVLYTLAISSLLPIGGFMCLIGLVIVYWADKYLLYRRMVCKNYIATLLNKEMFKMLHLSIVFFALGNLVVNCLPLYDENGNRFSSDFLSVGYIALSLVGVIIALLFQYVIPTKFGISAIYRKYYSKQIKKNIKTTYDEFKELYFEDYDLYHPASRERKIQQNILNQIQESFSDNDDISDDGESKSQKSVKEFIKEDDLVQNQISSIKCNQNNLQSKSVLYSPQNSLSNASKSKQNKKDQNQNNVFQKANSQFIDPDGIEDDDQSQITDNQKQEGKVINDKNVLDNNSENFVIRPSQRLQQDNDKIKQQNLDDQNNQNGIIDLRKGDVEIDQVFSPTKKINVKSQKRQQR